MFSRQTGKPTTRTSQETPSLSPVWWSSVCTNCTAQLTEAFNSWLGSHSQSDLPLTVRGRE